MKKFFAACVLLFCGIWFLHLWGNGNLAFYVLPKFNFLVISSGILLASLGAFLLASKNHWHQVSHHLKPKSLLPFLALFSLAVAVPPQPLSSHSVGQRGFETDLSQIKLTTRVNFQIDSRQRSFGDWIKIIGSSENPRQHDGEKAQIKGFVYRDQTLQNNEFYLARFLVRCCSADARPVVLRVKSKNAAALPNDQWLEITGTFQTDQNPQQPLFVKLESLAEIEIPSVPYIY